MLLLGLDLGTSSIKASVVDAATSICIASVQYPDEESGIISLQPGWAEQSPEQWWQDIQSAILKLNATNKFNPKDIAAIGIAYQMHGLVCIDRENQVLRNSIIWCDSRAVKYGEKALTAIGVEKSLAFLLNSPGNFTASKLAWVKENEPILFNKIHKVLLPGDFVSLKLTGEINTTIPALSEGIFWDFKNESLSDDVFNFFGFDKNLIPNILPVFSNYGTLLPAVAEKLSLTSGIPITYKAGDQPNNALSLNVMEPGEVAATAGTSGVIYAVGDGLTSDRLSRINSFAHVNYTEAQKNIGVLLCINGTGILNQWIKNIAGNLSYEQMNQLAANIPAGSAGVLVLPFGNGAERMLQNQQVHAHIQHLDFNSHSKAHLFRAAQEGIAFAFRYGLDIMRENNLHPTIIKAGNANLFLSNVFIEAFVNATNTPVELYNNDGSVGAAMGAGIGVSYYKNAKEAFQLTNPIKTIYPQYFQAYDAYYHSWKNCLEQVIKK
ncbi:MAG: carbohydrate kinase [Sphingobacteriia bacterium]|nr:MAG: carbohydrate kinase [Sphingobacteriia bacterium]